MDADDYTCQLSEKDLKYCEEILHETDENREVLIKELKEWLDNNEHLNAKKDIFNVLKFLRVAKFNLDKAKDKVTQYYTFKTTAPEWFENRNPLLPELQELLKIGVFLPLLKRDNEGRLVILIRGAAHNPSIHEQNDFFKIGIMTLDLALRSEDTSVYGVVAVFDMKGAGLAHARAMTVEIIKKAVTSWTIYPVRLRALEFINAPRYIDIVLDVFRYFMSKKLRKRIRVHGHDRKSLHSVIPKEILPEEYGGTDGKLKDLAEYWQETVTKAQKWFEEDEPHKCHKDFVDKS